MATLDQLIHNRDLAFRLPKEELREAFRQGTEEKVKAVMERLSDTEWLKQMEPEKVSSLTTKMLCVLPASVPMEQIQGYFSAIEPLKPTEPFESFHKTLLHENRGLLLRMRTYPLTPPPWDNPLAKLAVFESALKIHCDDSIGFMLAEKIPLKAKSYQGHSVLELALNEWNLPAIRNILSRVAEELEEPIAYLQESLWALYDDEEAIREFLSACKEAGIDPAPLVYSPNKKDFFERCSSLSLLELLLELLSPESAENALNEGGDRLLHNFASEDSDVESLVNYLRERKIWTPFERLDLNRMLSSSFCMILSTLNKEDRNTLLQKIEINEGNLIRFRRKAGLGIYLHEAGIITE